MNFYKIGAIIFLFIIIYLAVDYRSILRYSPDETTLKCDTRSCKTFDKEIDIDISDGISDLDASEIKKAGEKIQKDMDKWVEKIKCNKDCKKTSSFSISLIIKPHKNPPPKDKGQCTGSHIIGPEKITGKGERGGIIMTSCDKAKVDALNKAYDYVKKKVEELCGTNCDGEISLSYKELESCQKQSDGSETYVIEISGEITCTEKPLNKKYEVILKGEACVTCGNPPAANPPEPKTEEGVAE